MGTHSHCYNQKKQHITTNTELNLSIFSNTSMACKIQHVIEENENYLLATDTPRTGGQLKTAYDLAILQTTALKLKGISYISTSILLSTSLVITAVIIDQNYATYYNYNVLTNVIVYSSIFLWYFSHILISSIYSYTQHKRSKAMLPILLANKSTNIEKPFELEIEKHLQATHLQKVLFGLPDSDKVLCGFKVFANKTLSRIFWNDKLAVPNQAILRQCTENVKVRNLPSEVNSHKIEGNENYLLEPGNIKSGQQVKIAYASAILAADLHVNPNYGKIELKIKIFMVVGFFYGLGIGLFKNIYEFDYVHSRIYFSMISTVPFFCASFLTDCISFS